MARFLISRRWVAAHLVVVALAVLFTSLGLWQLRRLEDRRLSNAIMSSRYGEPPQPLETLVVAAGSEIISLEGRRAIARGTFVREGEALIYSQVEAGTAGYHVITPMVLALGEVVLVNRGWVPLDMDQLPVLAEPPRGEVEIKGLIALDQARPDDPLESARLLPRVDIEAINRSALPAYLIMEGERSDRLPIPLPPPDFTSEGNHLAYAIQWFSFALIGLVGYATLIRREWKRQVGHDLDPGHAPENVGVDLDLR